MSIRLIYHIIKLLCFSSTVINKKLINNIKVDFMQLAKATKWILLAVVMKARTDKKLFYQ